jgi:hypothetical protein
MKIQNLFITKLIFTVTFLVFNNYSYAQIQKGNDIDGEAAGDESGYSVSMPDSNTVAIGAPKNDGNGTDAGHVRVYEWDGSVWMQKGADIDGEAAGDNSGWSVSMPDVNTVAIGAPKNDGTGTDAGHVRVYEWDGSVWVQKGADIDGEAAGDLSGWSVSMPDANTVAIGATKNDGTGPDAGHVRVYEWNGSAWVQKGADIDAEASYDEAGYSISMPDANTIAIGAIFNDGVASESGQVRVYEWNGSAWLQKGSDIDGAVLYDRLGYSVSMPDANNISIGVTGNDDNGIFAGQVQIYTWTGNAWVLKGSKINGEAAYDYSGHSVSMPHAGIVAIGASGNDDAGFEAGHVRIYGWNGMDWVQRGNDIDGEAHSDYSGTSVSMPDANTVAIGAPLNDGNGPGFERGHVRVYTLCTHSSASISPIACFSYTSPSGNYSWTTSGTYMDTIPNSAGCDSVISINLTLYTVDISVTNTSPTLTANASGATYQWLDCDNAMAVITGENNQNFTATANGNYAVEITQNGCVDTSACEAITNVGILLNDFGNTLMIYPNPSDGNITLDLGAVYGEIIINVKNKLGQEVSRQTFSISQKLQLTIPGEAGVYFIEVNTKSKKAILKVLKD